MPKLNLRVYRNGSQVHLVWQWPSAERIRDCRGFAVYRGLNGREPEAIPSHVGFETEKWQPGAQKPSTVWPIQKYKWTDYQVRHSNTVSYRVVPMVGSPGALQPREDLACEWSEVYTLDSQVSKSFSCYFNRGIVATQWVQKILGPQEAVRARARKLDQVIVDYNDRGARAALAGELRGGLLTLLNKAKTENLKAYAALFELADKELEDALAALGKNAFVVLADGALEKGKKKGATINNDVSVGHRASSQKQKDPKVAKDENYQAREFLTSKVSLHDRMTKGKFLAHNKILVVCATDGTPRWTWTGSTNWTPSGLCTQANNSILIDDVEIATAFRDQVVRLAKSKGISPPALASENSQPKRFKTPNLTVWFTRTNKLVDLKDACQLVAEAKQAALFLMFQTGLKDSLLGAILSRQSDKDFYIHGVISSVPRAGGQRPKPGTPKHKITKEEAVANQVGFVHKGERVQYAPDLLLPFAIEKKMGWFDEFVKKNGAHAIVHSKIVVLDPFGSNSVVMTGSHNLGKNASQKNDENLVIVRGDRALAEAYAVNIISIYDNFRWRYRVASKSKWRGLSDNDRWQDRYLGAGPDRKELDLWMGDGAHFTANAAAAL